MTPSKPTFRHPETFQLLKHREYIRRQLPTGSAGFVAEDLDLVIRHYGATYNLDDTGRFMLCELKYGRAPVDYAQRRTFGLLHQLLRTADPEKQRYLGLYVIHYDHEDWEQANFTVNGMAVSQERFIAFVQGETAGIPALPWLPAAPRRR
jgi:hypothetical protein